MAHRGLSVSTIFSYIVGGAVLLSILVALFEPSRPSSIPISKADFTYKPVIRSDYTINFDEDFDLASALKSELGISIFIAIDRSNSMAETPESGGTEAKSVIAQRVMKQIGDYLATLRSKYKDLPIYVGVIGFNNELYSIFPTQKLDNKTLVDLQRAIADPNNFEPSGKTAIGDAIELGCTELMKTGQILRSIIVVTDGENTISTEPEAVIKAINENSNNINGDEVVLHTFGTMVSIIGFDIETTFFEPMRNEGARIIATKDEKSLFGALSEVLDADISKFEEGAKLP